MKTKTKKKIVRLLSSLMIVFAIFNLIGMIAGTGSKSYAADGFQVSSLLDNAIITGIGIAMGGLPLIIMLVLKLIILVLGFVVQIIMSGAFSSLEGSLRWAGLKGIIFAGNSNASQFLDVNFFDLSVSGTLLVFREAVAKWYYILRLICAAILLVILIYVGIRMAISTIASEQAKYKQMLVDWVTSLALLFLLHYIIIFIITINGTLVEMISNVNGVANDDCTETMLKSILLSVFSPGLEGFFAAIMYFMYVGSIFSFFLLYIKRMITVGFLIMISPLITITYSIDKMGDGKAQALNAWLKELSYNILIQPFHCIIFMAFFNAIAQIIGTNAFSIGAYIFAIVIMRFMKKAEEILRKIFHFEASSMSSLSESGQNIANATGKFVGMGMAAGGTIANFKAAGGFKGAKEKLQEYRASEQARKDLKKYFENDKSGKNGPPSITANSFREYEESRAGKEKLEALKQRNLDQMKTQAEENRSKRKERREEKVKQKAEAELRKEMGDRVYEALRTRADGGDRNAQKVISDKEDKVREGSFPKRTIKGVAKGASNIASNVTDAGKRFMASDYGKLVGAATKDSLKVAAAIGMGAFALGATGELNDAVSLGQTGYGFAKGFLQNSTRTIIKDSSEKTEQLAALMNIDPSNIEEISKLLASVTAEKKAGALDTKSISNQLEKLREEISSLFSDRIKGSTEANAFINQIQAASIEGVLKPDEIERLIEEQFENLDKDEKDKITVEANNYARIILKAGIATNGTTLESAGRDIDEHDLEVASRVSKKYSSANV